MRVPRVVALIPDGNRRYAKKKGISYAEAYTRGARKVWEFLNFCKERGVEYVMIYTLSLDNVRKRSKEELSVLFGLIRKHVEEVKGGEPPFVPYFGGELSVLPEDIRREIEKVEGKGEGMKVGFLIGYSGEEEFRRIAEQGSIEKGLYLPHFPPADLLIRTSGEMRLSAFLPYHLMYAELVFYPKLWPEMERKDFEAIFEEYARRERRFGA